MAKTSANTIKDDIIAVTEEDDPNIIALDRIFDTIQGTDTDVIKARVYRIRQDGKQPYLFDFQPDEIDTVHNRIRDEYGNGTYKTVIYRNGRIIRNIQLEIEATEKPKPQQPQQNDMTAIVDLIQRNNAAMMERFERLLQPSTVAMPDPFQMLERMTTIMKNLQPVQAPQPQTNPMQAIELFTKGFDVAREVAGGEDNSIMGIIREIAKQPEVGSAIASVATNLFSRGHSSGDAQPLPPQDDGRLPPPEPAAAPHPMAQAIAYLVSRAEAKSNAALYAEWLYDNVPETAVRQMLAAPDLQPQLEAAFPAVARHREWFSAMIAEARQMGDSAAPHSETVIDEQPAGNGADDVAGVAGR